MVNVLTIAEIAQLAVNAGIPNGSQTLNTCVAICLAESGGDFDINNEGLNSDGTVDYGGWQINSIHNPPVPAIYTPSVNAKYMMDISSNGSNWVPWVAYNNGAYLTKLGPVMAELTGKTFTPGPGSELGTGTSGAGNGSTAQTVGITDMFKGANGMVDFFKALTKGTTWVRVLKVWIGCLIVYVAVWGVVNTSKPAKKAMDIGMMVATKGKSKMAKAATATSAVKDSANG